MPRIILFHTNYPERGSARVVVDERVILQTRNPLALYQDYEDWTRITSTGAVPESRDLPGFSKSFPLTTKP